MTAYEYAQKEQILFLGLSNGKLFSYKSKNIEQKSIFCDGKFPDMQEIDSPNCHKGEIRKIIYAKVNNNTLDVIITASSDRTIKLWEAKNVKSNPCF
jgi:WD40 repeat protein